jgi:predicted nuclease of restriction endonuclease-like RecB superfamily
MYWLEINPDSANNIICTVEGASNVIKLTERYGNSIAKLVPLIFKANNWSLKADILKDTGNGNKAIYNFEISKNMYPDTISLETLRALMPNESQSAGGKNNTEKKSTDKIYNNKSIIKDDFFFINNFDNNSTITYDSNVEKTFAQKFELFSTGWTLEREPEPLITKFKTAFISDFVLTKHENKVVVEIIGFWTSEYLERKIQKIVQIIENYNNNNFYMILIINFENLAMYEINHIQYLSGIKNKSNILIISYKNENIPFKDIIPFLKKIEKRYIDQSFENKTDKDKVLQQIKAILEEFRGSPAAVLQITLTDINEILKSSQKELDPRFNLKEIIENNGEIKSSVEEITKSNELITVRDVIFKEAYIKEILKELRDTKIENLKDACDFLSIKKIYERIHIDLLIFMGFEIYWNGLDYSKSKIMFIQQ